MKFKRRALLLFVLAAPAAGQGAPPRATIDWPVYAHDAAGTKYSPAAAITRENVGRLVPIWTYRSGDFVVGANMARDETTPLFVDGTLFVSTPFGGVRALDAETGRERWSFDSQVDLSGDYGDFTNRGVSTWVDPAARADAACKRRIFIGAVDARLIALDARTGAPCEQFGTHGALHRRQRRDRARVRAGLRLRPRPG